MAKIFLINPLSPDPPPTYFGPPYGLAWIAAVLRDNNLGVVCRDYERSSKQAMLDSVAGIIANNNIKYVGISTQSTNRNYCYDLIEHIKGINPEILIILGGPFATQKYRLILKNFAVDYIVLGDGEITFTELIQALEENKPVTRVKGISYKKNNKIINTGPRARSILDELPLPAIEYFNTDHALNKSSGILFDECRKRQIFKFKGKRCLGLPNALMVLSSIGCIYSCSFCPMSGISCQKYRQHSPQYFVDMVEAWHRRYGHKYFVFGDNLFTKDIERSKEICRRLIKKELAIKWICMTRTDYLDKQLLQLMRRAGCIEISFGVESCSPKVQQAIGKQLKLNSISQAFTWCNEVGIRTVLMLMVGNQAEDRHSIYQTLSYVRCLEPDQIQVKVTKVYPGTRIHEQFQNAGLINDDYYLGSEINPPAFTLEHSLEELNDFRRMIQPRNIDFVLTGQCNNNCDFCSYRECNINKTQDEIKNDILRLADRTDFMTFLGGEPLLRKDFFDILDYAKLVSIRKIKVKSNGRIFLYKEIIDKIIKANIREVIIPFYTADASKYQRLTKVKGAFEQTLQGIKNLCRVNSDFVSIQVNLGRDNYKGIYPITRLLLLLGVKNIIYNYSLFPLVKDIQSVRQSFLECKRELRGVNYKIRGLPYCALPSLCDKMDEIYHPFDEIYTLEGALLNKGKIRRSKKNKRKHCCDCQWNYICEGYWHAL
jgi:radical SAM superfamily enzyme YgiQ (UPF0313 family)/MoaA/NifB/PqqE/SkfB family radical SAM enzyme